MYLHMQEPKIDLASVQSLDKISENAHKELSYKGLFLDEYKEYLANGKYHLNDSIYNQKKQIFYFSYNEKLYSDAGKSIKNGHFLINPYSSDGRSVDGEQLKAITQFEEIVICLMRVSYTNCLEKTSVKDSLELMKTKIEEEDNDI